MAHRPDFERNLALLRSWLPSHQAMAPNGHHYHVCLPSGEVVSAWPPTGKWRRHAKDAETHWSFQSLLEYAYPRLGPLREAVSALRALIDAQAALNMQPGEEKLLAALVKNCKSVLDTDWIGPQFLPECAHLQFPPPNPSQAVAFGNTGQLSMATTMAESDEDRLRREIRRATKFDFMDLDDDIPF